MTPHARRPGPPASQWGVLRDALSPAAYRAVASHAKYPVGAVLVSYALLSFGLTATLSQLLGSRRFGEFAVVVTITGIFRLLASFSVESGVPKFIAESAQSSQGEMRAYYAAGLATRVSGGLISLLLAAAFARWVAARYGVPHLSRSVVACALYLCVVSPIASFFLACIQGREQPGRWSTATLVNASLVFPAGVIGAVGFPRWGLQGLFLCIAAGWLAAAISSTLFARRAMGFTWALADRRHLSVLVPFLLPLWVGELISIGSHIILKSYLAVTSGPVSVGQFEIAIALLFQVGTLYQAIMIVFLPTWARLYATQQGATLLESFSRTRGVVVGMASFFGLTLALAGQWIVPLIFGHDQAGAVPAVRVMGLVMPLTFLSWVTLSTYVISNRTAVSARANILWFVIVVPAGLLLIPRLGSLGGSVAFLIGYIVFNWYVLTRARPFFARLHGWAEAAPNARTSDLP